MSITSVRGFLSVNPEIGIISPIVGAMLPLIHSLTPLLQFAGLFVGLGVGILTLYLKWQEVRNRRKFNRALVEKEQKALTDKARGNQNGHITNKD